jgi:predicted phosphodiesterase
MRVAALFDVHGNLPALEAVLDDLERLEPDLLVFGGDVAAGALPRETIDLLRSLDGARFVRGNCERHLLERVPGPLTGWAAGELDDAQRTFLAAFEQTVVVDGVLYCHASPSSDEARVTILTSDRSAAEVMGDVEQPIAVIGHTHSQFDRMIGSLRLVNAGSVGMPYEDRPGAYWALVEEGEPELRTTDYDLRAAADRIRTSGWPEAERWVDENLLRVPSALEAAEYLESQREADPSPGEHASGKPAG